MSVPTIGTLTIANARLAAADALAPVASDDPEVLTNIVDAVSPPALMVGWGDPWIESAPPTMGAKILRARLVVWCIAGRLEPGPGVETLERLVSYVADRLNASPYPWGLPTASAPRVFPVGGIDYLGSQVAYSVPVTTSED